MPMSKQKNPPEKGSFQQVAVLLERVESELKRVSEGHQFLIQKIDEQIGQFRGEMSEQFALVHQTLREHQKEHAT